jgi:membrane protein
MVRSVVRDVVKGFDDHDLMTSASAIAFQILTTLIPLVMCATALLGFLHLKDAWTLHLAPQVRDSVSPATFKLIDSFVRTASQNQQAFWLLAGVPLVVWESSGAVRAVMGALCRIYCTEEDRSRLRKYLTSFALGLAACVLILLTVAVVRFTPDVTDGVVLSILRYPVGFLLLVSLVWLLMHYAPAHPIPAHWASFGSVLCVVVWLMVSAGFGFYATEVVDYSSIFSTLALAFVTFLYLYLSCCAFLFGAQLDAIVRRERTGSSSGVRIGRRRKRAETATPRPVR